MRIILYSLSIILFPVMLLLFIFPVLVYFIPLVNAELAGTVSTVFIVFWMAGFLSSLVLLSSYCGVLCPVTKLFTVIASLTKNRAILAHRFPKAVGTVVQVLWLVGFAYAFLRFLGNELNFLPEARAFSNPAILLLLGLYTTSMALLNTATGKDELGHYLCPLSPFIKAGIALNKLLRLPGYKMTPEPRLCTCCGRCNNACPYQNDVMEMVRAGRFNYKLCSNCGECASACARRAVKRAWADIV